MTTKRMEEDWQEKQKKIESIREEKVNIVLRKEAKELKMVGYNYIFGELSDIGQVGDKKQ